MSLIFMLSFYLGVISWAVCNLTLDVGLNLDMVVYRFKGNSIFFVDYFFFELLFFTFWLFEMLN